MLDRFFDNNSDDEPADILPCAVCAMLVAAARADGAFAPDEAREIARLVSGHFHLSPEATAELVSAAAVENRKDLFGVARAVNERVERGRRSEILRLMWRVVFADGRLEAHEDALMHRAAKMLEISHRDLIALKLAVKREQDAGADIKKS